MSRLTFRIVVVTFVFVSFFPFRSVYATWAIDARGDVYDATPQVLGVQTRDTSEMDEDTRQKQIPYILDQVHVSTPSAYPSGLIRRAQLEQMRVSPHNPEGSTSASIDDVAPMSGGRDRQPIDVEIDTTDGRRLTQTQDKLEITRPEAPTHPVELRSATESATLEMYRDRLKVKLPYPVVINPTTHTVEVETAIGRIPVNVMPEEARATLVNKYKMIIPATTNPTPQVENGKLNYTYTGVKQLKLFGLIPVTVAKTMYVSASDGSVQEGKQSGFFARIAEALGSE